MRKPSLTFDTFVAALAVLGVSASASCSKADRTSASPEPTVAPAPAAETKATPSASGEGAPPTPVPTAAASAPTTSSEAARTPIAAPTKVAPDDKATKNAAPVTGTAVDSGAASRKRNDADGGAMTCGAGMCSADMKKGN